VTFLSRYDKHADYNSKFGNITYSNKTQLYGISHGLDISYKYPVLKNMAVKVGFGYYRLKVDWLKQSTPWGVATARSLEYDDGITNYGYNTTKYHYNNIQLNAGLLANFPLKGKSAVFVGGEVLYYHTFSQRYNLDMGDPYKPGNSRPLGFGVNSYVGIHKLYKKIYIQPKIVVPIYQQLRGDKVFKEEPSLRFSNWFNGGGLAISVGKYI